MGEKENLGEEFKEYNKKESLKRSTYIYIHMYVCICIIDALCCIPETNTALSINYTPIKIFKKRRNTSK